MALHPFFKPFFLTRNSGTKGLVLIFTTIISAALNFILCGPFATIASAETINAAEYFPLESGIEWTYRENGLNTVIFSVLQGYEIVNGVPTKVVEQTGGELSGTKVNYTNDSNGIRRHKEFGPNVFIEGIGFVNITVTLTPPMKYANPTANTGEILNSSGTASVTLSGYGTFNFDYDSTIKIAGVENITVPLGNFDAFKMQSSLKLSGYINGDYTSQTLTSTYWFAKYIGEIKGTSVSGSETNTVELTGINFSPPIAADFSGEPENGLPPLTVEFHDESIGYVDNWSWNFGDGGSSTDQNPTHTYTDAGAYTVSLTVTGLGGSNSQIKERLIRVAHNGADIDNDGVVDLEDAISALQVLTKTESSPINYDGISINGDYKVGLDEVVYILQWLSELR